MISGRTVFFFCGGTLSVDREGADLRFWRVLLRRRTIRVIRRRGVVKVRR